jgi:hypothetical protein
MKTNESLLQNSLTTKYWLQHKFNEIKDLPVITNQAKQLMIDDAIKTATETLIRIWIGDVIIPKM